MLPKSILEAVLLASPLVTAHDIHHEASDGATINPRAAPPRGKDTSKLSRPKLGSVPYGPNLKSCTVPGKVALTFDDGPYAYTSALLDLLAKNKAKATFFLNANNVDGLITDPAKGYIPVVKRMFNEGHHIGSHSYTHANFDKISTEERRNEIIYNEIAIADIIGVFPTYFRPPYTACGGSCESDISALGYHVVCHTHHLSCSAASFLARPMTNTITGQLRRGHQGLGRRLQQGAPDIQRGHRFWQPQGFILHLPGPRHSSRDCSLSGSIHD